MHVAIIGGGAAGMVSAHYLAKSHRVTVFERQSVLGGNIRTINRNVETIGLANDLILDNGVIEFHLKHSPGLHALIGELGLELEKTTGGSSGLYLEGGQSFHMPGAIRDQQRGVLTRTMQYAKIAWQMRYLLPIRIRMFRSRSGSELSVASFLGDDTMSRWLRMLLMYGYSIPYSRIDAFPARIAIPTLLQGSMGTEWVCLKGGVYRYIEEIIGQAGPNLSIRTGQENIVVARNSKGVRVESSDGVLQADCVVFATPPDQVLSLLGDADAAERSRFGPWQANYAETIIHTDQSIYQDWKLHGYTEFDLFEKEGGRDAGYNAYLNRLCGIPSNHGKHYFLAYNLEERIDPSTILDRQKHHTPLYTTGAISTVDEIKASNGHNNTFHAGAYLYNGLHEGAIQSALALKALFEL